MSPCNPRRRLCRASSSTRRPSSLVVAPPHPWEAKSHARSPPARPSALFIMPLGALASAPSGAVFIAHGPTCGSASVLWLSAGPSTAAPPAGAASNGGASGGGGGAASPPLPPPPPPTTVVTGAVALPGLDGATPLVGAAFSASGDAVAAVTDAKTVWLWRLAGGEEGGGAAQAVLVAEWCVVSSGAFLSGACGWVCSGGHDGGGGGRGGGGGCPLQLGSSSSRSCGGCGAHPFCPGLVRGAQGPVPGSLRDTTH